MNTTITQSKMQYLAAIGYTVTALDNGTVIASYDETEILLNDNAMEVRSGKTYYKLEGWKALNLHAFVNVAFAFGIVPMTNEEKAQSAHIMEHYGVAFLNQLS